VKRRREGQKLQPELFEKVSLTPPLSPRSCGEREELELMGLVDDSYRVNSFHSFTNSYKRPRKYGPTQLLSLLTQRHTRRRMEGFQRGG
jgi:hypothetical protein